MVWIDYAIIALISFSCLISLTRGFIHELLSLATWGYTFFIFSHYYDKLSVYLTNFEDTWIRSGIVIAIMIVAILILGSIINFLVKKLIEKTSLSIINRLLGIIFGALRGVFIISIILFFCNMFTWFPESETWHKSQLIPKIISITIWLFNYLI